MASAAGENVYNYDGLDESDIRKAKKELGENPDKVLAQVASLRRWVKSMRHLTCRTDDVFLLRFLRTAKFEQSRAQQLIDNFCTVRSSPRGCPEWFRPMPFDSPQMRFFLQMPVSLLLGHNDNGEAIVYSNMSQFDPDKISVEEFVRCVYVANDVSFSGERAVIHGVKFVTDMKGTTRKQMDTWSSPKLMLKLVRNMQDAAPIRMKAFIYYNEPTYLDVLLALCLPVMKEKLRKRICKCGSDVDKLKKAIGPGAERLLPVEFGGTNKTLAELIANQAAVVTGEAAERERQLLSIIHVDEDKREPDTKDFLKTLDKLEDPNMGISGTFTKLNVD